MEYLKRFCAGDIDGLEPLLAADLNFTGTFHTYHSASEYLDSLRRNPPEKCGYKVLSVTESEDSVAVFYEYQKTKQTVKLAQLFRITKQQIDDVVLVFDGRGIV
jgi:hypothetical protein